MKNPLSLTLAILLSAATLLLPAALAQNETASPKRSGLTRPGDEHLDRVFRSYERLNLDARDAARQVREKGRLVINTGRRTFDLELELHDMRAANYTAEETIAPGVTRRVEMGAVRTYKGRALGSEGVEARFTIDEESLEGLILTPGELYYVEPARRYLPSAARTEFLLYKGSDVIETEPASCAADTLHGKIGGAAGQLGKESPTASASVTGGGPSPLALARPLEAELATEADFEYVNALGGSAAANAEILSIMNQVEGIYQRDIGLSFRITNQHTWATSSDPYTATDAVAALNELTKYWNANFTTVQRDVVHMWTGKNVTYNGQSGIAGVAWGGGASGGVVCKSPTNSYGLSEMRTTTPNKIVLPAHELGHNFDGVHTDGVAGCGSTVMRSYAGPDSVLSFCPASITRITNHINANSSCLSAAPVCTFTISPTSASFTAAGGSDTFSVTASDASCDWTATSNDAFIHITAGASGTGSGRVSYTVDANTAAASRTGTITAAGRTYTVTQAGATVCTFTISPTSASVAATGATGSVSVTAPAGCAWTAASNVPWARITAGANGTGNGTVSYTVDANTATTARSGTLTIAGQTFTINQAAAPCAFTISPTSASFAAAGGTGSLSVTTTAGCAWTARSNVAWLTITAGASGNGNGTVSYTVAANTATTSRTGTITAAGKTFTVTQAGAVVCTFTLRTTSASVPAAGGTGTITVTGPTACTWTAVSNAAFIHITAGGSGSGNGTASFRVDANTATVSRRGTITIAGKTFTVNQAAAACTFTISPTSASFTSAGGTGSISVTTTTGCAWTAKSNIAWITITAGASGSGSGTVSYRVAANTATTARTGTITAAGKTFTVTQAGAPPSLTSLVVNPASVIGGCQTATGTVTLSSAAPSGGTVVALSDNIAATTLPASVTVAAGTTTKTFNITTAAVTVNQGGTVTATLNGLNKTDTLGVRAIGVSSVSVSPNPIIGGNTATGTVTLECPAAPGNLTVTLSDNIASTTLPASVVVTAGTSSKTFSITTTAVANNQVGTLTATAGGVSKSVSVTVRRIGIASLTLSPTSVTAGTNSTGTVTLERAAGPNGIVVTLSSSNTSAATVPASITIPAGTTSKTFTVTTHPVNATTNVNITATANSTSKSATLTVNPGGEM